MIKSKQYEEEQVTVILTCWKRNNFDEQIASIAKQSKRPKEIWVWQNESHVKLEKEELEKHGIPVSIIKSEDINFKFHGRFTLPLLCDTEYVAIFDDDTIPGELWLENCLRLSKEKNCIVGANGRTIEPDFRSYDPAGKWQQSVGGNTHLENDTIVDFVGHCWFFKSCWAKNIWRDRPFTWDNGEDIHFAASCKIYEGIGCYVPKMPIDDTRMWGDLRGNLGQDQHATWRLGNHNLLRHKVVGYWRDRGWRFAHDRD